MWENRCKVALSGVGFSKVTRSAELPLAAHALTAVEAAVADSGLEMSDIDGLATYPELPATGHAEVDGISIVSVNCIATDLKFEAVRGAGTIYAYTIMYHTGDKRFAAAVPYASIIVELDDAPGALLAGNLLEAPYTEAKVGRRVEVVFEKLNDDITLPQFRLVRVA